MGDFDFGFTSGPREPGRREGSARARQGFSEPYDRSPFKNPSGWYDGSVHQTGGMVMVRTWSTLPDGHGVVYDEKPGRKYEYEIAYGEDPGVSINRYVWDGDAFRDGKGAYQWDGIVEAPNVPENTDHAKARIARELMKKHSGKTR